MENQTTHTLLMIRPVAFGFNIQTAENNYFQQQDDQNAQKIQEQALSEFNKMTDTLKSKGINLIIIDDTPDPHTPDSIFPNNWITFHDDGTIALYPMYAQNRRLERREDILAQIKNQGYRITKTIDYTPDERENKILEGTGSMILDRASKIAYATISERTDKELFLKFCKDFSYKPVCFHAFQTADNKRLPIYHTNVMMCIGDKYAVVCLETIDNEAERRSVSDSFLASGKEIICITEAQMYQFAGNMLQVENNDEEKFLIMSQSAYNSLSENQIKRLNSFNKIIKVPIPTIEKYGGGSARCMLAEVFLPKK